jgi:hypothetical protein
MFSFPPTAQPVHTTQTVHMLTAHPTCAGGPGALPGHRCKRGGGIHFVVLERARRDRHRRRVMRDKAPPRRRSRPHDAWSWIGLPSRRIRPRVTVRARSPDPRNRPLPHRATRRRATLPQLISGPHHHHHIPPRPHPRIFRPLPLPIALFPPLCRSSTRFHRSGAAAARQKGACAASHSVCGHKTASTYVACRLEALADPWSAGPRVRVDDGRGGELGRYYCSPGIL